MRALKPTGMVCTSKRRLMHIYHLASHLDNFAEGALAQQGGLFKANLYQEPASDCALSERDVCFPTCIVKNMSIIITGSNLSFVVALTYTQRLPPSISATGATGLSSCSSLREGTGMIQKYDERKQHDVDTNICILRASAV